MINKIDFKKQIVNDNTTLLLHMIIEESNPALQVVQLAPHLCRETVPHLVCEVVPHALRLLPPEVCWCGEELVYVLTPGNVQQVHLLPGGHPAYWSATGWNDSVTPPQDPLNHPDVIPEARPQQATVLTLPEPVDHEELGRFGQQFAHVEPVLEVGTEVVAEERSHGERVVHHLLPLVLRCCRGLGLDGGPQKDAVLPGDSFISRKRLLKFQLKIFN